MPLSVTKILLFYVRWSQVVICFMTLIIFFLNLHNQTTPYKSDWCEHGDESDEYNCVGPNLFWRTGDRPTYDWNLQWRGVWTFKPQEFVDLWTPFVFAVAGGACHLGVPIRTLCATWYHTFAFYLLMSLYSQFGYAGNFGVFWGFWTTC